MHDRLCHFRKICRCAFRQLKTLPFSQTWMNTPPPKSWPQTKIIRDIRTHCWRWECWQFAGSRLMIIAHRQYTALHGDTEAGSLHWNLRPSGRQISPPITRLAHGCVCPISLTMFKDEGLLKFCPYTSPFTSWFSCFERTRAFKSWSNGIPVVSLWWLCFMTMKIMKLLRSAHVSPFKGIPSFVVEQWLYHTTLLTAPYVLS